MTYTNKIRTLEQELSRLEQSSTTDPKNTERRNAIINELRDLRRLQWDLDHERINLDDDR